MMEVETMMTPRQPLPVGFRFQPTDKEIFDHYLKRRTIGLLFSNDVPDIKSTMLDPWELLGEFKDEFNYQGNENDWWFFWPRVRYQKTARLTGSGKWESTCSDKEIMDDRNQIMGIMTSFVFHLRQGEGRGQYKRFANWKLYEYRFTNEGLDGLPLPDDNIFALCHLKRDNKAKSKTDVQDLQTNGEISSGVQPRQRKRMTMESAGAQAPFRLQENSPSSYQPQCQIPFNVQRPVEPFRSSSSTIEVSLGNSSGSRSSGSVDFSEDIPSTSLEDQTALLSYEEQLQTEMLLQNLIAAQLPQVSAQESLLHQPELLWDTSSSSQKNTPILLNNRRTKSTKSVSGVVPAEEKKTCVENRIARPQPSPPLSPDIVEKPKNFKSSNSPSSAESLSKDEARIVKREPLAANPHWKEIGAAKIEEDEGLAQETTEKLRLKTGPILITQNQNSLSSQLEYSFRVAVGLILAYLICSQMLCPGILLFVWMLLIRFLMKSESGSTL